MEKYDDEWLEANYLRGSMERAIAKLERQGHLSFEDGKTLKRLRGGLRMIQARMEKADE